MAKFLDVLNDKGEFTGEVKTIQDCHSEGLWHRISYGFIFNTSKDVLLQKRSFNKINPMLWDKTIGGHVESGESCFKTLLRKTKSEIGIDLASNEIEHFGCAIAEYKDNDVNCHIFAECYIIRKNLNINDLKINKDEIKELKWFTKTEILEKIENKDKTLISKNFLWNFLKQIYNNIIV